MPSHHDALFKLAFAQPSDAAALLRELVPPSLARAIDWSSLRLSSGSFVDESLRGRFSDLLFEVRIGDTQALLYLLCEHQRRNEPRMPLRFSRYMDRIWAREDERVPEAGESAREAYLPPIIPILISNAPGGWTAPTRFHELFDPALFEAEAELARFVPSFELLVDDLRRTSDDAMASRVVAGFAKLALWLLRDGRGDRLFTAIKYWAPLLEDLSERQLEAVVRYIDAVGGGDRVILDEFCATLELTAPKAKENVMTHLEKLISQGEARGRQEGRQELLRKQLLRKFGELPSMVELRLAGASASDLDAWGERVLFADTLEQVFADEH